MVSGKAGVDAKDRAIIHEFEMDGRAPIVKLSKAARMSREAVSYRVDKLLDGGVINCFVTKVDLNRLGLTNYGVFFKLANVDRKVADEIISFFVDHPDTLWVASLGGKFDLAVEIAARSTRHFNVIYNDVLSRYAKYLGHGDIAIRLYQTGFTHGFIHEKKDERQCPALDEVPEVVLEDSGRKLLNVLVSKPRATLLEISKAVREPPSTVAYRFKQLKKNGIIRGFTVLLEADSLGYSTYKLFLSLREFSFKTWQSIFDFCCTHPNVSYVVKAIGKWEVEIELETEDRRKHQEFIMQVRNVFGDVIQDMESVEIFHTHKYVCCPRLEVK